MTSLDGSYFEEYALSILRSTFNVAPSSSLEIEVVSRITARPSLEYVYLAGLKMEEIYRKYIVSNFECWAAEAKEIEEVKMASACDE